MPNTLYCLSDLADIVVRALIKAANEHGAPNGYYPGELAALYSGGAYITAMQVGRAAPWAVARLKQRGWDVTYSDRCFRVEQGGEGYAS